MSPRALTEQEKWIQCQKLFEKGKSIVMNYGIKKVSVDDIAKAAGIAKGSFYKHFDSKEQYLCRLVWKIHEEFISQAKSIIKQANPENLEGILREFIRNMMLSNENLFFFKNAKELDELLESMPQNELISYSEIEKNAYARMIELAGFNTEKVKPGVVHNYLHTMYFMKYSDMLIKEDLDETFEIMLGSLMHYIFRGAK